MVGHARIMAVVGRGDAVLIETGRHTVGGYDVCCITLSFATLSVVVATHLRGCGLGRRLMEAAEKHAHK